MKVSCEKKKNNLIRSKSAIMGQPRKGHLNLTLVLNELTFLDFLFKFQNILNFYYRIVKLYCFL